MPPRRSSNSSLRSDRGGKGPRGARKNSSGTPTCVRLQFPGGAPRNFALEKCGAWKRSRGPNPRDASYLRRPIQKRPWCIVREEMGARDRRPETAQAPRRVPRRSLQIPPTNSGKNDKQSCRSEGFAGRVPHPSPSRSESCREVLQSGTFAARPDARSHSQLLPPYSGRELFRAAARRENTRGTAQKSTGERVC